MKKTWILAALCAAAAIAVCGCSSKKERGEFTVEKGKLTIGMEVGYPPFEYFDTDGKTPCGFDVELGKEIAKRLGLQPEFVDIAWDGILGGLDTEKYDAIMSAMTITPERKANYDFSMPYIGNGQSIIVIKGSTLKISSPDDLKGLKVGYQAETTSDFFMKKQEKENGVNYVHEEYDKVMNAYDDLRLGRIDAVCSDYLVAVDYLGKKGSPFECVWKGTPDEYFGVCVKQGNSALLDKVNEALSGMKADGTLKTIYEKVFGMDLSDSIPQ